MYGVVQDESKQPSIPFAFRLLTMVRIMMILLLCWTYYNYSQEAAGWQRGYVIAASCLFLINHFSFSRFGPRWALWQIGLDFLLACGFAVVFLGQGYPYELFFGIIGVTLMLWTDNKRLLVMSAVLLFVVWVGILIAEYVRMDVVHGLNSAMNIGFVVFSCVVGSLIRYYMQSREKIAVLYAELEESHRALGEYAKQVEMLTAVRERNHIAREIHDTVGHSMTALLVQLQAARKMQERDLEQSRDLLVNCEEVARSALQQVRLSVQAIREEEAQQATLLDSLRQLLGDFAKMTGLDTQLQVHGHLHAVPETLKPTIYRIVQESLTNAKRHGDATSAAVEVKGTEREVRLTISDDGTGTAEVVPGFGLINLRERVMEFGGTVLFASQQGGGFRTEVSFPLQEQTWKFGGREA
ncbi:signal transduction histidine kinase [Tumebacillus sp. BK434]|uniref:sensor histidine kinase n=1 Tax=Tumebacillus sp. BK434 TaxID=2512169 RepID=UPI00104491B1|nr:sensor histidine kinase [Tumebacillus sp. BK434]TCP58060.1 signal transduction histidine kinase [Tumebacillus sp. BK434]